MSVRVANILLVTICLGTGGCFLFGGPNNLVGQPEPAPPLQRVLPGLSDVKLEASDGLPSISAAQNAARADLAGIWIHAGGFGAVHISTDGIIFQVDLADVLNGEPVPDLIPRTFFNAGTANVASNGLTTANINISLAGLSATVSMRGTLDATHNIIFAVNTVTTLNLGSGPDVSHDDTPWFRWDPATGRFPALP